MKVIKIYKTLSALPTMYLDASLVKIHQDNTRKRSKADADADTDGIRTKNNITLSVVGEGAGVYLFFDRSPYWHRLAICLQKYY